MTAPMAERTEVRLAGGFDLVDALGLSDSETAVRIVALCSDSQAAIHFADLLVSAGPDCDSGAKILSFETQVEKSIAIPFRFDVVEKP